MYLHVVEIVRWQHCMERPYCIKMNQLYLVFFCCCLCCVFPRKPSQPRKYSVPRVNINTLTALHPAPRTPPCPTTPATPPLSASAAIVHAPCFHMHLGPSSCTGHPPYNASQPTQTIPKKTNSNYISYVFHTITCSYYVFPALRGALGGRPGPFFPAGDAVVGEPSTAALLPGPSALGAPGVSGLGSS